MLGDRDYSQGQSTVLWKLVHQIDDPVEYTVAGKTLEGNDLHPVVCGGRCVDPPRSHPFFLATLLFATLSQGSVALAWH